MAVALTAATAIVKRAGLTEYAHDIRDLGIRPSGATSGDPLGHCFDVLNHYQHRSFR